MKNFALVFVLLLSSVLLFGQNERPLWQDGKIWIKVKADYPVKRQVSFNGSASENPNDLPFNTLQFIERLSGKYQFTRLSRPFHQAKNYEPLENLYQIDFTDYANADNIIKDLQNIEGVEYAEKVPMMYTTITVPNDTYYNTTNAWGLFKINAGMAWDYSLGSSAITVAVVDNAMQMAHPDLSGAWWTNPGEIAGNGIDDDGNGYIDDVNGYDVADDDNNPNPPSTSFDHGTHVSGIVGASTNNSTGVASIGYGVSVIPVKSTADAASPTSVTNGYDGIIYAANTGADVINLSWGGYSYSTTAQNIINYAYGQGCIIVAAAGNDDITTSHYPSSYNNVISVASTTTDDSKSSFSNYGSDIDVSAPGSFIYSTLPNNTYGYMSGTSMASPMVAGLCGLMLSLNPGLTQTDVQTCLENTCDDIDAANPSYINQLGAGRINAEAAMSCVSSTLGWAPVADFTANITTVSAGGNVTFTDQSIYNPTSWTWTFNGGTPASYSGQTPGAIQYNTPGVYDVKLVVSNANGSDSITKTSYITVLPANTCDTITNTEPGDNMYYYNYGANGYLGGHNGYQITAWADKYTNTYPAGTYIHYVDFYFAVGMTNSSTAFITATIWDDTGAGGTPGAVLDSKNILLEDIEYDVTNNYITRWYLDNDVALPAGDFYVGFTLTMANGDTVCLTMTQDLAPIAGRSNTLWIYNAFGGAAWETYTTYSATELSAHIYLGVSTTPVASSISPTSATICEGDAVNFSSSGCTNASNVEWYFNGSPTDTTTVPDPSIIFDTPGTHTQYLVAYNTCGHWAVDSMDVVVNPVPSVSVSADIDTICGSGSSNLLATGASSYTWTPATGLSSTTIPNPVATPAATTTYTVVGTSGGCSNDASITIYVEDPPTASFNYNPTSPLCDNTPITFDGSGSTNASTFSWTFPGGTPASSTAVNPTVTFSAGSHTVKLVVENGCGAKDSTTTVINVNAMPSLTVTATPDTLCAPGTTQLLASGATNYAWSPSTGLSSTTIANPVATLASTQTYTVIGSNGACADTATIEIFVDQAPVAAFNYSPTAPLCDNTPISFNGSISTNADNYMWSFPGGSPASSTAMNPTSTFTSGAHTVTLIVQNSCGAYDTTTTVINVEVYPSLAVTATPDTLCAPGTTQLLASGATNYTWSPSTGLSSTTIANPIATLASTQTYTVIGANGACADTMDITIFVDQAPVAAINYTPMSPLCDNISIDFDGSSSTNAANYTWVFQNGTPGTSPSVTETVDFPAGTHNIILIVQNSCGAYDSTSTNIIVNAAPQPTIIANDSVFCTNTTYSLDAGSGYTNYSWTGGSSTTNLLSISSTTAGNQDYSVTVTDGNGCEGSDTITIAYVVCSEVISYGDMPLIVYPNPAHNNVFIEGITESCRIYIVSADGRLVSDQMTNSDVSLNISMLSAGVYFLNIEGDNTKSVFRLVVE
ncbi:MAG: hypothetical protein C0592_10605 [Marinilabiliales bacterium]|nr:MAG: hypothetical protein C0592_10605 [Marinilabiliales bacterium]